MSFSCFQTWPLKSIAVFRPGIMSSLLRLERKQKDFLKSIFEFALLLFVSYSFGVGLCLYSLIFLSPRLVSPFSRGVIFTRALVSLIRSYTFVLPSKTIPDSRPKWVQPLPVFEPKRRKDPTIWACTYLYGLNKEVHPPRFNKIS